MSVEHQALIDYLDKVAEERQLSQGELSTLIDISTDQLYNLKSGKQPGLTICLRIARGMNLKPDYVLWLAGHITEAELDAPEVLPAELMPTLNKLSRLRGTPFFTRALDIIEDVVDHMAELFKEAA
jgi:DNA-binding XRE family transcriptional regulator